MALLREISVQDIQEQLFESNQFLLHSTDHSLYAKGATVYVPMAGSAPNTERSRATLPAVATAQADAALSYTIASRSSDPVKVPDLESFQLSYDKRQSVMLQHLDKLMEDAGKDIAFEWSANLPARIVRTSGALSGRSLAVGATGQRKAVMLADIARLVQLFGFNIIVKPSIPIYNNAGSPTPKVVGCSAATDNLAGIAWQKNCVARAIGGIEVYENAKDATYYGDVLSAKLFCGSKLRSDEVGVAALVQSA